MKSFFVFLVILILPILLWGQSEQPLHLAVSEKQEQLVLELLQAGADPDLPTGKGWYPLHLAAEVGDRAIARHLMEYGASPGRENDYGFTPLGIAQENGDTAMARLILDLSRRTALSKDSDTEIVLQTSMLEVHHLEFSADTHYLLVNDNLFEVKSGRKLGDFDAVMACFSRHQPFLFALEGKEGVPILWNWRTEEKIGKFALEGIGKDFLPRNTFYNGQKIWESPDGRLLITVYEDIFRAWDVWSGKEIRLPLLRRKGIAHVDVAGDYVLTADSTGEIAIYQGFESSSPVFSEKKGRKIAQSGLLRQGALYYCLYEPADKTMPFVLEVWDWKKKALFFEMEMHATVTALDLSADAGRLAYATADTTIHVLNLDQTPGSVWKDQHRGLIRSLRFSPGGAWLASGSEDRTARLFDVEKGRLLQSYESLLQQDIGSKIGFIEFSPDGRHIHTGVIGKLFDLHWPGVVSVYATESALSPDGVYLVRKGLKEHVNDLVVIRMADYLQAAHEGATPKELAYFPEGKILEGNGQKPKKIEISTDNKWVMALTDGNTVLVWNLQSGDRVFSMAYPQKVEELTFSPDSKQLILRYAPSGAEVLSIEAFEKVLMATHASYSRTGQWMGYIQDKWLTIQDREGQERMRLKIMEDLPLQFAFSHNEKWLVALSAREGLALWDIAENKYLRYFEEPNAYNRIAFSPDDRYLAIKIATRVEVWETATGKKVLVADDHSYTASDIAFSPDSRFLAVAGNKGYSIVLWELDRRLPGFQIFFPGSSVFDNHYIITTPAGPYLGTKFASKSLSFKRGLKIFPFDQFDLAYNRPDQVLEQLGHTDPQVIATYRKAFEKRLQKMGFDQTPATLEEWSLPEVEISGEAMPRVVESSALSFLVRAQDQRHLIRRMQVFVNDVPWFGSEGLDLGPFAAQQVERMVDIALSNGENKVEVSAFNDQGIESLRETFYVSCVDAGREPDLYLIALGAGRFADPLMDLRYAAKDAEDLAAFFADTSAVHYGRVIVEKHIDEAVTRELLQQLKTRLMESRIEDHVIFYVAGHGVVDENLDYYLATYDTDFSRPGGKGIPYEELESLLDGIPARQKLFLLDACHSGEIDKESVALIKEKQTADGKVQFRSFDTRIVPVYSGLENAFELMKQLFVDLRRGNGATVISSASAVEFAMEGDRWNNGVFVYCLLTGLSGMAADLDKNGRVMLSELQNYLATEVPILTDGRQQPAFRVENISKDWQVWRNAPSKN